MTWASKEEQVMHLVRQHMERMSPEKKRVLIEHYSTIFFPRETQNNYDDVKWTTSFGVTFVTMWDREHLMGNLRLAMIKEMIGEGPEEYYVINNWMPNFESKLLLLVHFLPHKKFRIFPPAPTLEGPFTHSPWLEIGEDIRHRSVDLKNPFLHKVYYSQQHVIFTKTGIYGPPIWNLEVLDQTRTELRNNEEEIES